MREDEFIFIKLMGGLGNQLFQYSFGRWLERLSGRRIVFDDITGFRKDLYNRENDLLKLNIKTLFVSIDKRFKQFLPHKLLVKVINRFPLINMVTSKKVIFENKFRIMELKASIYYYIGFWQDIAFVDEETIEYIRQCSLLKNKKNNIKNIFRGEVVVSVHFRSYGVVNGQVFDEALKYHGEMEASYYRKAIHLLKQTIEEPVFVVFSDNYKRAKELFSDFNGKYYFYCDINNNSDYVDEFKNMLCADHFIIANSTFSWWAATLSQNKNKIVICPQKWFNFVEDKINNIYPNTWIKI